MKEKSQRALIVALGVGLSLALMALEFASEDAAVSSADLLQDSLQIALLVFAITGLALAALHLRSRHGERAALLDELAILRSEEAQWRRSANELAGGLGKAIDQQFTRWRLSSSEREVAMLMLKGLVHKEIGALRGTAVATVRQQAASIYKKSELPGRAAFCAFFLEDILAPVHSSTQTDDE